MRFQNSLIYALLSIFSFLLTMCNESTRDESVFDVSYQKTLVVNDIEDTVFMGSISHGNTRYLRLVSDSNHLVGRIKKLRCINGNIYIHDDIRNSIVLFDSTGFFLSEYRKEGKGPGEYDKISDFDLLSDNNRVVILVDNKKLLFLNDSLKFLRKVELDHRTNSLLAVSENIFLFSTDVFTTRNASTGDSLFQLYSYNMKSKGKQFFFYNTLAKSQGIGLENSLTVSDKYIFRIPLTNDFYTITNNHLLKYSIDFGKRKYNAERESERTGTIMNSFLAMDDKVKYFHNLYMANDNLFFESIYNKRSLYCFYNLQNDDSFACKVLFDSALNCIIQDIVGVVDHKFVFAVSPYLLDGNSIIGSINQVNDYDNPILVFYDLENSLTR